MASPPPPPHLSMPAPQAWKISSKIQHVPHGVPQATTAHHQWIDTVPNINAQLSHRHGTEYILLYKEQGTTDSVDTVRLIRVRHCSTPNKCIRYVFRGKRMLSRGEQRAMKKLMRKVLAFVDQERYHRTYLPNGICHDTAPPLHTSSCTVPLHMYTRELPGRRRSLRSNKLARYPSDCCNPELPPR